MIQRVLEHCNAEQTRLVLAELLENAEQLVLVSVSMCIECTAKLLN